MREIIHSARSLAGLYPSIFYTVYQIKRSNRPLMVRKDTELVIEGYPRSANTFAVIAFQQSQKRDVRIAHHLHVPAQIMRASAWKIPAIVLLRKPEDAIVSLMIRYPYVNPARCYREYIQFYERIWPYKADFIVAEFSLVTGDFGAIIRQTNEKFATSFGVFQHSEENVNAAFQGVDEVHTSIGEEPNQISRPTVEKERLKSISYEKVADNRYQHLASLANEWYERFLTLSELPE